MRSHRQSIPLAFSLGLGLGLGLASSAAWAGVPDCSTLPNPVFIPGTTDIKPFLARVAPKLETATGADQMTLVYQALGSCTAADYILAGTDLTGTAVYWTGAYNMDGTPVEATCTVAASTQADLALSDVTVRTCTGADIPAGTGEFSSMVQGFGFVVPPNSSQQAITATEGYFLYKFGGEVDYQVPPWTDPAFVFVRTPAASTQLLTGLAVGVPGNMWSANLTASQSGSTAMIAAVAAENSTGNAEKTIGILSLQRYDGVRDQVRILAFEAFGQECLGGGVYPDSTSTTFDKQNVRDGHYPIWGNLWAITAVGGTGAPSGLAAAQFITFLTGTASINGADPIGDAARVGAVPACAMKVSRAYDGAPLESFAPAEPCGCFFESVTGTTDCETCSGTCAAGVCRFGYCEEN